MDKELFNSSALDRLRSPEQLDVMFSVTRPVTWMSLGAIVLIVASIMLWCVFGSLAETVGCVGLIVDAGGVTNVVHPASGQVEDILVRPGDRVKKGDVIARLMSPELDSEIIVAKQKMQQAGSYQEVLGNLSTFDTKLIKRDIVRYVVSSCDGIVSELRVNPGDMVTAGATSICSIRNDEARDDMRAMVFVPAETGRRVRPGMMVQLAPSSADTSQTGTLMGVVREVADFPSSSAGINRLFGNPDIVSWLLQRSGGAAIEVRVDLIRDAKSPSGYLWSSVVGSPPKIASGEVCTGSVVVEKQAPLSKAFFKLSQWLRED